MSFLSYILSLLVMGLLVGALGRLLIPGPNPMSIPATVAVGIGGVLLGGLVGSVLFGSDAPGLLLAIIAGAVIVWLVERGRAPAS